MLFGRTNFQFKNGADGTLEYHSITTSYVYDPMITECGDANETKFKAVRNFIAKCLPLPAIPIPSPSPKSWYGTIQCVSYATQLKYFTNLVESLFLPCMQDRDVILLDGVRKIR
jgi:hypothetical protein